MNVSAASTAERMSGGGRTGDLRGVSRTLMVAAPDWTRFVPGPQGDAQHLEEPLRLAPIGRSVPVNEPRYLRGISAHF
jgi:hypothetical protein